VTAAANLPFNTTDIGLLALGVAVLLGLGIIALVVTELVAGPSKSAVTEGHAGGVNRLRAIPESASGGHAREQA
jgi:hypothetical protein